MHDYFQTGTSPGRFSKAARYGAETQHPTHSGQWDRNPLVAAMLEIRLSMTGHPLDFTVYDTLDLWSRVCGGIAPQRLHHGVHTGGGPAGYRVPTSRAYDPDFDTYRTNPDGKESYHQFGVTVGGGVNNVEVTDFSPLVAYGSLELLRSQWMSKLQACKSVSETEDAMLWIKCNLKESILDQELITRSRRSPFNIQRSLWCNPHARITIEEAFGNPDYFSSFLLDTELKEDFSINGLKVQPRLRGEEDLTVDDDDDAWMRRSLRSWVYVTSSADKDIRAGMYRLSDLPLFRAESCAAMPMAQCSDERYYSERKPALFGGVNGNDPFNVLPGTTFDDVVGGDSPEPAEIVLADEKPPRDGFSQATMQQVKGLQKLIRDGRMKFGDLPADMQERVRERTGGEDITSASVQNEVTLAIALSIAAFKRDGQGASTHSNAALNFARRGGGGGIAPVEGATSRRKLFFGGLFASFGALPNLLANTMAAVHGNLHGAMQSANGMLNAIKKAVQAPQYLQYRKKYLNQGKQPEYGLGTASKWRTGREALVYHRCNHMLKVYFQQNGYGDPCQHHPYAAYQNSGCTSKDLILESDPGAYGHKFFFGRFLPVPSPSPPPPPPSPHPPPAPPSPNPPPAPPVQETQELVMGYIRAAEEQACTTVYYLSQTTRCERLALALTQPYLIKFLSPPMPPPIGDGTSPSPPPVPPPSPLLPSGFGMVTPAHFLLSTMRYPLVIPPNEVLEPDGYYMGDTPGAIAVLRLRLAAYTTAQMVCNPTQALACASGSVVDRCINGARRCGTAEENARDPFVEFEFELTRDSYLWAIRFALPRRSELLDLFVGTKRLELYGPRNTPIPCFEGDAEIIATPDEYYVNVICAAPTATDDQLRALATVWRARLTLTGEYRQVWLSHENPVQVIERPLSAAEVEVLALPPSPMQPPSPAPPPFGGTCTLAVRSWLDTGVLKREHEPCGMSHDACCAARYDRGARSYEMDDAGCCTLLFMDPFLPFPPFVSDGNRVGRWTTRSGTGY